MSAPSPTSDPVPAATPPADTGRDANGRFAKGNPGGPGNPYYRRQAHFKRVLLEAITEDDVRSVVQVLLGLARGGNLAAIKLYFEYAAGKVDPDKAELHEWGLHQQAPPLGEVIGLLGQNLPAAAANQTVRNTLPIVADCHLKRLSQSICDGRDFEGEQIAPPLDGPPTGAKSEGGKQPGPSARRMAAGVRPPAADESDDEDDDIFLPWFAEEINGPDPTGDNGDDDPAPRPRRNGRTGPERRIDPGLE
jgi:hypothetical protein